MAEGVETEQQLEQLRLNGCEQFQGYLFFRQVPHDEFVALLRRSRRCPLINRSGRLG